MIVMAYTFRNIETSKYIAVPKAGDSTINTIELQLKANLKSSLKIGGSPLKEPARSPQTNASPEIVAKENFAGTRMKVSINYTQDIIKEQENKVEPIKETLTPANHVEECIERKEVAQKSENIIAISSVNKSIVEDAMYLSPRNSSKRIGCRSGDGKFCWGCFLI
eukprot:TRINITY_DN17639_c0_g1_i2.p1 TRINITY_DN17639_c0_g1~~TRINITY_DN17639_c0_g1_i2.p1  ORF type:complete len:165 (+),score=16.40 TRINITY_DN17639_c0_g1_i2:62-556(+)